MAASLKPRIAVIGGGWAGLAAASRLADRLGPAGTEPTAEIHLFEAAPAMGGRAKGLFWQHPSDPALKAPIDNGQHLILGAHRRTLDWLTRLGVLQTQWQSNPLIWRDRQAGRQLQLGNGPLWQLAMAQLWLRAKSRAKRQHLGLVWPIDLLRLLSAIRSARNQRAQAGQQHVDQSTAKLAESLGLSEAFTQRFYGPLVEAILNTPVDQASASVFLTVLSEVLDPKAPMSRCWHPVTHLGQDALDPWQTWLTDRGVRLHCGQRVRRIERAASKAQTGQQWLLESHGSLTDPGVLDQAFDAVLVCCAPWHAKDLVDQSPNAFRPDAPAVEQLHRCLQREPLAIATAWLWLPAGITDRALSWSGLSTQAVYPLSLPSSLQDVRAIGLFRPAGPWGRLASLSFSALRNPDRAQLEQEANDLFVTWLGPWAQDHPRRLVIEKQATWSCEVGTHGADPHQPADLRASHPLTDGASGGLWLASDAHQPGLPATIESAVLAGERAADQAIDTLTSTHKR
ncbi:MAG: FAD-dependent oxidoreductase [Burkholderiaceae bacterium]